MDYHCEEKECIVITRSDSDEAILLKKNLKYTNSIV